jgi:hypothetical protein
MLAQSFKDNSASKSTHSKDCFQFGFTKLPPHLGKNPHTSIAILCGNSVFKYPLNIGALVCFAKQLSQRRLRRGLRNKAPVISNAAPSLAVGRSVGFGSAHGKHGQSEGSLSSGGQANSAAQWGIRTKEWSNGGNSDLSSGYNQLVFDDNDSATAVSF